MHDLDHMTMETYYIGDLVQENRDGKFGRISRVITGAVEADRLYIVKFESGERLRLGWELNLVARRDQVSPIIHPQKPIV